MNYEAYLAAELNSKTHTFKDVTREDGDEAIWYSVSVTRRSQRPMRRRNARMHG